MASVRQIRAITGGSVMPMASGKAMTGDASASAASVIAAPWPLPARSWAARALLVIRNVAYNSRKVAAASQGRGSPRMPGSPSAFGSPKTAITGRYGL